MKKHEIKRHINECNYMFSDNDNDTLSFWKEAVAKIPNFVIKEINSLVEFSKNDAEFGNPLGFSFNIEYKEIFRTLNLNLRYEM